jgi:hypothetical protein
MPRMGAIQQPIFTGDGVASGAIVPGTAVGIDTTYTANADRDGIKQLTAGFADGIASGAPMGGGTVNSFAAGDPIQYYKPGSEAVAILTGAVTDLAVPLKVSGNGFTPVTGAGQTYNCKPLETGAIGQYIAVYVCNGTY